MAAVKNKLKVARTAIGKRDFSAAQEASLEVLELDPSNYNASVLRSNQLPRTGRSPQGSQ